MTSRHPARLRLLTTVALMALLAGGCFAGDTDDSGDVEPTFGAPGAAPPTTVATDAALSGSRDLSDVASEGPPGSGSTIQKAVLQVNNAARDIIFRADMVVAVTDVTAAGASAVAAIQGLGGIVFGQQTTSTPTPRSVLTFKVLPDDFQRALDRLGELGDVRSQNITADDVTERVVDLESRITTAAASVERLRNLLLEATDIMTIAQLENQLLERETQLETLRGQLRTLEDQVALATIIVTFVEAESHPQVELVASAYPGHEDAGQSCPGDSGFDVVEGDPVTVCFEITNVGDTALGGFTLSDPVLGLEGSDLIVVFGDPDSVLEPGQNLMLATELTLDRDLRTRTRVEATPVDGDGNPIAGRKVADTVTIFLNTVDEGGLPGFRDGLEASWSFLRDVGGVIVLAAGAALPFVWVLFVAGAWLWVRSRRRDEQPSGPEMGEPPTPAMTV